jgi:subtilisin family serine protease
MKAVALARGLAIVALAASLVGVATAASGKPDSPRAGNARDVATADPATRFVPGEVLVRFRGGVSAAARGSALGEQGAMLRHELLVPGLVLARLKSGQSVSAAVDAFSKRADVLYAEPNWIYRPTTTPNDPRFASGELWGLHNTGQNGGTPDADIDAPEAWNTTTGSTTVVVAVTDTGVAYDHPDLAPNMWTNPGEVADGLDNDGNGKVDDIKGWDFIDNDNDPRDISAHGTHVAGTIGAKGNNATGVVGVNWNVKIMPVRVLGPMGGTNATVTDGFAYAAQKGAKVVNASLGGGGPLPQAMKDAIDAASGTLYVIAAGNGGADGIGDNNEMTPQWPCNITSANLICVAATTRTDGIAGFSNFGTTSVDVGAPGTEILSTWLGYSSKFTDGFETDTGWIAGGSPSTWARTAESAVFGSVSATDSPGVPYSDFTDNWFRAPGPFSLTGGVGCSVEYAMKLNTESGFDWFVVDGSTNGSTWTEVGAWTGTTTGYPGSWFMFEEDLSQFDGAPTFFLRVGLESDETITAQGAHIDGVDVRCVGTTYTSDSYETIQGTSMATPHVAGVAALAWAKNPSVSVATVKSAILNGGDSIASLSGKTATGRRLNANGALALIPEPAAVGLTVTKGGNGGGTVTGTGINCGGDCFEMYSPGTVVVLAAATPYASVFGGWSNCDSPSGTTCTMTMSSTKNVTATFTTTPTFADVPPSNPFYDYIEQLYDLGITQGCGTNGSGQPIFCPTEFVPRQQMAAFLVRAKGLTQLFPGTPTFADVPASNTFFGYVERLYEQGITQGCGTNGSGQPIFCPTEFVPRQQMAAFLIRAFA